MRVNAIAPGGFMTAPNRRWFGEKPAFREAFEAQIPMGRLTSYSGLAGKVCNPAAARAVGAAVGKNPIAFVVPCHRVIGKAGKLTGYHWGLTRKRAMLGWEAGQIAAAA